MLVKTVWLMQYGVVQDIKSWSFKIGMEVVPLPNT